MLDAATGRTRARGSAQPRTVPLCARAADMRHSDAAPCPPSWTAPCAINILLLEAQIKQRRIPPAPHHALKLEVRFCVRGVISPTLSKNRPEAAVSTYQYRLLNEAKSIAATASSAPG